MRMEGQNGEPHRHVGRGSVRRWFADFVEERRNAGESETSIARSYNLIRRGPPGAGSLASRPSAVPKSCWRLNAAVSGESAGSANCRIRYEIRSSSAAAFGSRVLVLTTTHASANCRTSSTFATTINSTYTSAPATTNAAKSSVSGRAEFQNVALQRVPDNSVTTVSWQKGRDVADSGTIGTNGQLDSPKRAETIG